MSSSSSSSSSSSPSPSIPIARRSSASPSPLSVQPRLSSSFTESLRFSPLPDPMSAGSLSVADQLAFMGGSPAASHADSAHGPGSLPTFAWPNSRIPDPFADPLRTSGSGPLSTPPHSSMHLPHHSHQHHHHRSTSASSSASASSTSAMSSPVPSPSPSPRHMSTSVGQSPLFHSLRSSSSSSVSGDEGRSASSGEVTVESLRAELEDERRRSAMYCREVQKLRESQGQWQNIIEQEEEYITNKLMKQMDTVRKEKSQLQLQLEEEERVLKRTKEELKNRIEAVRREKVAIENRLEQEEEFLVNKLNRQMEEIVREKNERHRELLQDRLEVLNDFRTAVDLLRSLSAGEVKVDDALAERIKTLDSRVDELQLRQDKFEADMCFIHQSNRDMFSQIESLRSENRVLQDRIANDRRRFESSDSDRSIRLSEIEDERRLNDHSRSRSGSGVSDSNSLSSLSSSPIRGSMMTTLGLGSSPIGSFLSNRNPSPSSGTSPARSSVKKFQDIRSNSLPPSVSPIALPKTGSVTSGVVSPTPQLPSPSHGGNSLSASMAASDHHTRSSPIVIPRQRNSMND